MARINNEDINHIRQTANISEVISQYIPIEKKGRNFVAICPFHEDTNPSMSISEDKQIFKCFVCGAGGNVFTFVSRYTNSSFIQSVKTVADYVNIPLDIKITETVHKVDERLEQPYAIMTESMNFLNYKLLNNDERNIDQYLNQRNLNAEDIQYFNIGFENDNSLVEFLNKKGYSDEQLESVNLVSISDFGSRSVFNNRLLFPIHNQYGQVVGYSGRALIDAEDIPKYINSNENIIYNKGSILYNYHRAQQAAKNDNIVYLVEGVMDVIGFYKADVLNCVATLGTAMTPEQARLLRQLSSNIVLSYDGDSAGRNATVKAIELLLAENMTIEVIDAFGELDPDDYVKKFGKDKFKNELSNRISYLDYLLKYYQQKFNLDNFEERKQFTVQLASFLSKISNNFDKEYLVDNIARLTNFSEKQISSLNEVNKPVVKRVVNKSESINFSIERAELNLIGQMLSGKEAAFFIRDNLGFLPNENLYTIYLSIIEQYHHTDHINEADLISIMSQANSLLESLILNIINNDTIIKEYNEDIINENIKLVQINLIDSKLKELRKSSSFDPSEQIKVIQEIATLQKQKNELLGK